MFETVDGPSEIYELCFHPAVVWFKDDEPFFQPHKRPSFNRGDFISLVDKVGIDLEIRNVNGQNPRPRTAVVVCHNSGHGTENDLNLLVEEINSCGFAPRVFTLP